MSTFRDRSGKLERSSFLVDFGVNESINRGDLTICRSVAYVVPKAPRAVKSGWLSTRKKHLCRFCVNVFTISPVVGCLHGSAAACTTAGHRNGACAPRSIDAQPKCDV